MTRPRSTAERIAATCKHFSGLTNVCCNAGVEYADVKVGRSFPCLKWYADGCAECDHAEFPTPEEVALQVEESERQTEHLLTALNAVKADAHERGLGKGNGGTGEIACPVCVTGQLGYSVAGSNGHVWGKCSTPGCVCWMM